MNLLRNLVLLYLFALLGCSSNIEVNIPEEAKSIGTYKVVLTEFIRNDKGLVTEEIYTTQLYEFNKVVETLEARRIHFEYDANDSLVEETYYTRAKKLTKKVTHKIGALEKVTTIFDQKSNLNSKTIYTYNNFRRVIKKENLIFEEKGETKFIDSTIYDNQNRPYLHFNSAVSPYTRETQTSYRTVYDSLSNVDYYIYLESGKEPDTINLINKFDGNILISTTVIDEYGDTTFVRNFKNGLISNSFLYKFYDTEKSEFDPMERLIRSEIIGEDRREITVYQYRDNFNAKISYELNIN
jgi:hypothetical protein